MNNRFKSAKRKVQSEKNQQKLYLNGIAECKGIVTIGNQETEHYTALLRSLGKVKAETKYVKRMDTKKIPYEIPEVYSLKEDIENLAVINKRIEILRHRICRKDIDAVESDWNRVGRDINEAIFRARRIHAGEPD